MKPHTIWTRGIVAGLNYEEHSHIVFDIDLYSENRFVMTMGTDTPAFEIRHHGRQDFSTYVANGR